MHKATIVDPVESSTEISMVHGSLIWLGLFSAELVAAFILRKTPGDVSYYGVAIGLTLLLWLATNLLGRRSLVNDVQEIALYDVLVQCIGLLLYWRDGGIALFVVLANTVNVMKSVRLIWPVLAPRWGLPLTWPVFGVLGLLRSHGRGAPSALTRAQAGFVYGLFPLFLLAGYAIERANAAWQGLPLSSCVTVILVFGGTARLIRSLEQREAQLREADRARAIAEGEARTNAGLVQSALVAKAAEEAAHAATSRLLAELAAHNSRLGDSAHALKVMLAPLFFKTGALFEQAENDETRDRARAVMEEVDLIGNKLVRLIDQAYIHPKVGMGEQGVKAVAMTPLCTYFFDRFNEMACESEVSLDVVAIDLDAASVVVNEDTLKDLIGNLLINAIKHGAPGEVTLTLARVDAGVRIGVENGGQGIVDAQSPDWDANFANVVARQAKASLDAQQHDSVDTRVAHLIQTGNKIGLRSVAHMADDVQCVIQLHSIPGQRTIFQFTLPLADSVTVHGAA